MSLTIDTKLSECAIPVKHNKIDKCIPFTFVESNSPWLSYVSFESQSANITSHSEISVQKLGDIQRDTEKWTIVENYF